MQQQALKRSDHVILARPWSGTVTRACQTILIVLYIASYIPFIVGMTGGVEISLAPFTTWPVMMLVINVIVGASKEGDLRFPIFNTVAGLVFWIVLTSLFFGLSMNVHELSAGHPFDAASFLVLSFDWRGLLFAAMILAAAAIANFAGFEMGRGIAWLWRQTHPARSIR